MSTDQATQELTEDIEVVGPGQMLAEAREKAKLTQQQVAEKLNFRTTLVKEIEQDIFDKNLPATFNRGYLRNYAKLVDLSVEDVLASYDTLNIAEKHGAEMQSFSKQTTKQAENNRLMWVSYLILMVLIGSSITWWLQDNQQSAASSELNNAKVSESPHSNSSNEVDATDEEALTSKAESLESDIVVANSNELNHEQALVSLAETLQPKPTVSSQSAETSTSLNGNANSEISTESAEIISAEEEFASAEQFSAPVEVSFTFSGDCWVNIYDATGERIAWGIKKSGYQMNITGVAPFSVTLGKPELVNIVFDGNAIDMSQFTQGDIAKFTLPLVP